MTAVRSPAAAKAVHSLGAVPAADTLADPLLLQAMAGCEALVHAAAHIGPGREAPDHAAVNVEGTPFALAALRKSGVKRVVHLSTECDLLNGHPLINPDERRPCPGRLPSAYSRTKAMAQRAAGPPGRFAIVNRA